jgi:hypothetical protein
VSRPPPASGGLATANYELRPLTRGDRADLFAHLSDPLTVAHMDIEALADIEGADTIIAWAMRLRTSGEGVRWTIRDHDGFFVGAAGLQRPGPRARLARRGGL